MNSVNYIYLLIEREFISLKQPIYKLGRTSQSNNLRLKHYPKGSILLLQMLCDNSIEIENLLIRWFKIKYIHKPDIGNEYFEGDYKKMIQDIYEVCFKSLDNIKTFNINPTNNIIECNQPIIHVNNEKEKSKINLSNSIQRQLILAKKMLKILDIENPHNIGQIIEKSKIILFRKFYNKNKDIYNYAFNILKELNIITIINIILKECSETKIKIYNSEYIIDKIEKLNHPKIIEVSKNDIKITKENWLNELQKYKYKAS